MAARALAIEWESAACQAGHEECDVREDVRPLPLLESKGGGGIEAGKLYASLTRRAAAGLRVPAAPGADPRSILLAASSLSASSASRHASITASARPPGATTCSLSARDSARSAGGGATGVQGEGKDQMFGLQKPVYRGHPYRALPVCTAPTQGH